MNDSDNKSSKPSNSQNQPVPTNNKIQSRSILGYVLGGASFIPLIGVSLGILAIIVGIVKKTKGAIFLGIGGILFSVLLYGGLFYFGFVAKTGIYADLKKQLIVQTLNNTKGQILIYKEKYGKYPDSLDELEKSSPKENPIFTSDPWMHKLIYSVDINGKYELKSSGPDGIPDTADDLMLTQ